MRTTIKTLNNTLDKVKRLYPEFGGITMVHSGKIMGIGRKVALFHTENGNYSMRCEYITYSEMNCFLLGYMACKDRDFIELPF